MNNKTFFQIIEALAPLIEPANRGELIAAISAAIATDMGTDVSGIRILSCRRV